MADIAEGEVETVGDIVGAIVAGTAVGAATEVDIVGAIVAAVEAEEAKQIPFSICNLVTLNVWHL